MSRRFAFGSSYTSVVIKNPQEIFLSNLYDWFDYTDDSTLTKTGVLLDAIDSKATGSTRQFTASGANRPDVVTGQINGLQVASFDGVSEFMSVPSSLNLYNFLYNNASGGMVLMVTKVTSDTGTNQFFIGNNYDSSVLVGYGIGTNSTKRLLSFIARGGGARVSNNNASSMYADYTSFNVFSEITFPNQATAANRSKINSNFGSDVQNNILTSAPSNLNASDLLTLGVRPSGGFYAAIDVAEIIITQNQPTGTQLTELQTYIENKYGGTFPI
jgi:hypothetical protein